MKRRCLHRAEGVSGASRCLHVNGYPPLAVVNVAGRKVPLDANTTVLSVMTAILILGVIAI